jgi:hypothetical protein
LIYDVPKEMLPKNGMETKSPEKLPPDHRQH